MFDVVALGELLVDFTPAGYSASGNIVFEQNAGGAPANVLVALSNLGGKGAFIGKVGNDHFGHFLKDVLQSNNINIDGLIFCDESNTTLAFVHLNQYGDRSFSFHRKPGADTLLKKEELNLNLINDCKIFHFGSLSMTDEPSRASTLAALEYARSNNRIISYDPNWRPPLWKDKDAAKQIISSGFKYADILKISDEELEFLLETKDIRSGSRELIDVGIKLVLVTLGPDGCYYRSISSEGYLDTFDTKVVDTTGAGDAFLGGLLYNISKLDVSLEELDQNTIEQMINFSNAMGALATTKKGAIPSMPSLDEVKNCIENIPKRVISGHGFRD